MCLNPFVQGMAAYGCGQCMPCRINRRRQWTHRIILESHLSELNSFVTLTYEDNHLKYSEKDSVVLPTLVPADLRNFLKRLRKRISPFRVRFFAVGEYGDQSERPHYHLALFGMAPCRIHHCDSVNRCPQCEIIHSCWGMGLISNQVLCAQSAAYIAGYVSKKLTRSDDERLFGRHPEFARMSRCPGIGRDALFDVADRLMFVEEEHGPMDDVPNALRHGPKMLPLDGYMRRSLRKMCGKDEKAPQATIDKVEVELQPLHQIASAVAESAPPVVRKEVERAAFLDELQKANAGKVSRQRSREQMFKKRVVL